jgi:FMN-dependent oxidoreductase (nitrilotriacetate monooxygenase family)
MVRKMKLAALMHTGGQHIAAWRHAEGHADAGFNLEYYQDLARTAEAAKFDFLFIADTMGVRDWPISVLSRCAQMTLVVEPLTLMTSLSAVTSHIGFVVTASTTYTQPYAVARQIASLDVLSQGRAAWNVVTGTQNNEAANFGFDKTLDHAERYARAAEFVEAVRGLWSTSEPGVFVGNKQSGILFDPEKIHVHHHQGKYYKVDGILNVPPSPQGRPVVVQAGASGPGRDLAASIAEVIFAQTPTIEVAQEYYGDIKRRIAAKGRDAGKVAVMPGFTPVIGRTREEAEQKIAELDAMIPDEVALTILSDLLGGVDLSRYKLDGPLPELDETANKSKTMVTMIKTVAASKNFSIREVAIWLASSMSHNRVAGTAVEIADMMQAWFENGACDGFLISPLVYPSGLRQFIAEVLPILRHRGLFRTDYEGKTLRANLGLA